MADCPRGIGALDRALREIFSKANIRDPQARVVLNMYADGSKGLNAHRHDYWTCLVSLGAPRVLLVDHRPHVLEDGDMIVFGTQMHGVPPMPDVTSGRTGVDQCTPGAGGGPRKVSQLYPANPPVHWHWYASWGTSTPLPRVVEESEHAAPLAHGALAHSSTSRSQFSFENPDWHWHRYVSAGTRSVVESTQKASLAHGVL